SAFLQADGRGDLRNMNLRIKADLAAALKEIGTFIQLRGWDGAGNLDLALDLKEKTQGISSASARLQVDRLLVNRDRRPVLPRQDLRADLSADIRVAERPAESTLIAPALNLRSAGIAADLRASKAAWNPSARLPDLADLALKAGLNLAQLTSLLNNLDLLTTGTAMEGDSALDLKGGLKDGTLLLDKAEVNTRKFAYHEDGRVIREDSLNLTTRGRVDLNRRSVNLAPVDILAGTGRVRIPQLVVSDWANARKDLKTRARIDLDLARLAKGYGELLQLPKDTALSGTGRFDVDADLSDPKNQAVKLRGEIAPFKMTSPNLPPVSEKKVLLQADVKRSPDGGRLAFDNLRLDSEALTLEAGGTLDQKGRERILEAKGTLAPDMRLVSEYLKRTRKVPIQFQGKKATPFTIRWVTGGDRPEDFLRQLKLSGALYVDSVEAFGLKLTPKEVPIRIADAAAEAKLESPANGGSLALAPAIDLRKDPYLLSFPRDLDILKQVQVTRGVTEGLLAWIHPMFKDAVKPEGLLDLHMKHFQWPLGPRAAEKASFAGSLGLKGIRMNSTPLLSQLLSVIGVRARELDLADQRMDFEARDGRVMCSPLTIHAGGYPLVLSGSIGFDGTLAYIAQLPITRNLVGAKAYQVLEGVTIKVPVGGTVSKPRIDNAAFQRALSGLVEEAMRRSIQKGFQNLLQDLLKKSQ
ncbi:MAG: hypothetical protein JW821_03605, partial [Deltaproteobacteria bacterium]|nr:hypothetical protein [Deltaproteobacteria bacterium]